PLYCRASTPRAHHLSTYVGLAHPALHSFPTRRSSDLPQADRVFQIFESHRAVGNVLDNAERTASARREDLGPSLRSPGVEPLPLDRKSTRLNSSHEWISYAVFCLKKKEPTRNRTSQTS